MNHVRLKYAMLSTAMVSLLVAPGAIAKESEPSIPEQIDELSHIVKLVSLEASIAQYQAKREKAIADIEKARAKRAWARVEKYKAEIALKNLESSPKADSSKERVDKKNDDAQKKK